MIHDKLVNANKYNLHPLLKKAFEHSLTLNESTPAGKIIIEGEDLFASVQEYTTKPFGQGKPETHKRYIDLQMLISGRESIIWYPENSLKLSEPYIKERDIEFYAQDTNIPGSTIEIVPGTFGLFFPWDIHMPQIESGKIMPVKKVVYKIDVNKLF